MDDDSSDEDGPVMKGIIRFQYLSHIPFDIFIFVHVNLFPLFHDLFLSVLNSLYVRLSLIMPSSNEQLFLVK